MKKTKKQEKSILLCKKKIHIAGLRNKVTTSNVFYLPKKLCLNQ